MRDVDVRRSLHAALEYEHRGDDSTLILDELGIANGRRRVDVAVVNGELTGYEIKSAADTLARLAGQADLYNRVFDRMWLLAAPGHVDEALQKVPPWWGICDATMDRDGRVLVTARRDARVNNTQDPLAIAQLLWRDEALEILRDFSLGDYQLRRGSRRHMYRVIADHVPLELLKARVRSALKTRVGWRN